MSIIYLKNDINKFVDEIFSELNKGTDVQVSMYGYRAIVFNGSHPDKVRIGIRRKLRAIRNLEINLDQLRKYSGLSEDEIKLIQSTLTPDEVADLCLDMGLVASAEKSRII